MAEIAKYPYNDYYLYKVFHKKEGRYYACLVSIKDGKHNRHSISFARYIMSVKLGRILNKYEHVDHIDNNKLNDDISNLQILTQLENNLKEAKRRGRVLVLIMCPICGAKIIKRKRDTHLQDSKKSSILVQ